MRKKKRKVNYKELARKYNLLQDLMEYTPDVIYFKDAKGRLVMVNEAHAKGLGLKPEEVVGKTDFDIHSKKSAERMVKDDLRVMKTGKPIIDKVERATRADGIDNYVSTTKIPRYDRKGRVIGLIGITRDITHRKRLEQLREEKALIEKKLEAAEELNKIKSEFVSVVSHELRTPLAILKESISLIIDRTSGKINRRQKRLLDIAERNIERLNGIIEELLDLSRIESGRFKLRYSLVDLNQLLKEQSQFFMKQAREKRIKLEYTLPKKHVNIFIDAGRITQVVTNLVSNAIKYTEQHGSVRVELKVLENKVRISVIDTGTGISKKDLSRLFNKFVQVARMSGAEKKGVGLGLSIAKELVEKHSGEIWVESKLGVGSRFYFTLPRFYTTSMLNHKVRERINNLLARDASTYLVNLLVVNYSEFKKKIKLRPANLASSLKDIIETAFKRHCRADMERPEIVLEDIKKGEYGIILPDADEKTVAAICGSIEDGIKNFLLENSLKSAFVNLGVASYPQKETPHTTGQLLANLSIKKIFIGANIRRFKRVFYSVNVEVLLPGDKKERSQTVDISEGGICFISTNRFNMNAKISIRIRLPEHKKPIYTEARIAWVRNIGNISPKAEKRRYKVGLEFTSLKKRDRGALSKLVKSASGR